MLVLALPVVAAELGWMAMGAVDTMMVGRLGAGPLGAVAVGRALFMGIGVFGMGILLGLDTLVSRAHGAGRPEEGRRALVHALVVALVATVPLFLLTRGAVIALGGWGMAPAVLEHTGPYLNALSFSLLPLLVYTAFRRYLQALGLVRPVMIALVSANLVNAAGNWVLIFGNLGAPALGAAGAGWATVLASAYLMVFLAGVVVLREREERAAWRGALTAFEARQFRRLLALGTPAALQLLLEVGVFAAATALAARLEPRWIAAHQIALVAASITYMVPLGFSSAAAVRVGQALGREDRAGAAAAGYAALTLGSVFMVLAALAFVGVPRWIVRAFTDVPAVIEAGVTLLAVAALFQLFDGLQVVATGALRGAGDTRTAMVSNLVGHWIIGLPVGAWLCFGRGHGAIGLWIGWLVGLSLVGLTLVLVWSRYARKWRAAASIELPERTS